MDLIYMKKDLEKQLDNIEKQIRSGQIKEASMHVEEWGGADVIITNTLTEESKKWRDQNNLVISTQKPQPKRRLVITEYSKELSWLFIQLKYVFSEKIDYISKYDFYGCLAQAALDYLDSNEDVHCQELLLIVMNMAREFNNP